MSTPSKRHAKWIAIGIAASCTIIQALILWHELAECLPFKAMGSENRYQQIAYIAIVLGPILSISFLIYMLRLHTSLVKIFALSASSSLVCPAVFITVYRLISPLPIESIYTADFSTQAAWNSFIEQAYFTILAGLLCTSVLLSFIFIVVRLIKLNIVMRFNPIHGYSVYDLKSSDTDDKLSSSSDCPPNPNGDK
jgi:hypothetical protein